jgi:fucose permease
MGEFGILFAIPLWLQNVLLLSPVESGMVLLWLAGGAFLASGVTGGLSGKVSPKILVQGGVALELIGAVGIALFASTEAGMWSIAPFLFVYGIGIGMATAQLTGVIMVDVPMDKVGQASGSQSTVRQVGSALGIAVLGTMLFTGVQSSLETRIADQGVSAEQSSAIVELVVDSAGGVIPGLTEILQTPATGTPLSPEVAKQITEDAGQAFTDGAKSSAWAAALFLLLGLFSTFNIGSAKVQTPAKTGSEE